MSSTIRRLFIDFMFETRAFVCTVALVGACLAACAGLATAQQGNGGKIKKARTKPDAVRTLDAITIEGQIDVPQVLFITARDFRRYRDGLGSKFRMNALEVARSADLPTRLRIVAKNKEEEK